MPVSADDLILERPRHPDEMGTLDLRAEGLGDTYAQAIFGAPAPVADYLDEHGYHHTAQHLRHQPLAQVAYLESIEVDPRHRGYGTQMMGLMLDGLRRATAQRVYLHAAHSQGTPITVLDRWYRQLGFQRYPTIDDYPWTGYRLDLRPPDRARDRPRPGGPPDARNWVLGFAYGQLWGPLAEWLHYPETCGKQPVFDAYASFSPRVRAAYDADVAQAFRAAHHADTVIAYRYKSQPSDMGGASLSTREPRYLDPARYRAYRVHVRDVLVHWNQRELPLASVAFGHEREIILRPDARPEPL
jgi:GNAT superfamily N-acetyltransferase